MKSTIKTLIASFTIFALTGLAQAQPSESTVQITEMDVNQSIFGPGYSDSIDLATIEQLDNAVMALPEFEQPNNFMSDEGVYRYAYYEKTGEWISLNEARNALRSGTAAPRNY